MSKELTWIKTSLGYELALDHGKLVCKNTKGKVIKSIPKKVKDLSEAQQLLEFSNWSGKHTENAHEKIQRWMQRLLSIPKEVIEGLWKDALWKKALENLVVAPVQKNKIVLEECGFLKGVSQKGIGIVNIDGETCWLKTEAIVIPHPVLLPDLVDLRELALDLGIKQSVLQIFREIWAAPHDQNRESKEISAYNGGYFEEMMHVLARCRSLGYKVSGGYAVCPIWEEGKMVEARFWIGSDYPECETYTGELVWVNEKGQSLKLKDIGPVAFSEGHRLASSIFAKRSKKEKEEQTFELPSAATENPNPPSSLIALSPEQQLEADGIIAAGAKVPKEYKCDSVEILFYEHAAVPQTQFSILTTSKLAPGDNVLMDYYGFKKVGASKNIGKRLNRALGFPAWALINDSKNAKYALDILKDFKKCAKKVKSKPGHARDEFNKIAINLGKTTPHFLPSFYEEVGRVFIREGNMQYGSQSFSKAREAEKVHALKIDEDMRREIFLEFALYGSLSIKVIKEYAKELEKLYKPDMAYDYFQALCAKRITGGVPPFTGMGKILNSLAAKTKQNDAKLHQKFLEEIIDAPILAKAPFEFWKYYSKAIKETCSKNDDYKAHLLMLFPKVENKKDYWFSLLEDINSLSLLKDKKLCQKYQLSPIKWLEKALSYCENYVPAEIFQIVRQYQKEFKREKKPLASAAFEESRYYKQISINADILDLLLELKIALELKEFQVEDEIIFQYWHQPEENQENQRELSFVSQNKHFAALVKKSLGDFLLSYQTSDRLKIEKLIEQRPHLKKLYIEYLQEMCTNCKDGLVTDYQAGVSKLTQILTPLTTIIYPELVKEISKIDPIKTLTQNLHEGVFAELGFIVFDEYLKKRSKKQREKLVISGVFPYLVVGNGGKITVFGPQSFQKNFDITIPKGYKYEKGYYIEGDLLVILEKDYYKNIAYWMSAPHNKITKDEYEYESLFNLGNIIGFCEPSLLSTLFPKNIMQGKSRLVEQDIFYDGKNYWVQSSGDKILEWDPQTSKSGRSSLPNFLQSFLKEGEELIFHFNQLNSLPAEIKSTPLGTKKGLCGWKIKKSGNTFFIEGIDGRKWHGKSEETPLFLMDWPGKTDKVLFCEKSDWYSDEVCAKTPKSLKTIFVVDEENKEQVLPYQWWHLLEPRDLKCSQELRKIPSKVVSKVFESIKKELEEDQKENLDKLISKQMPIVKNPYIAQGIANLFSKAAASMLTLEEKLQEEEQKKQGKIKIIDGEVLFSALCGLLNVSDAGWYDEKDPNIFPAINKLNKWLQKPPQKGTFENTCELDWMVLPSSLGTLAFIALCSTTNEGEREAILSFMETIANSPLMEYKDQIKIYRAKFSCKEEDIEKLIAKTYLQNNKESIYFIRHHDEYDPPITTTILEISTNKKVNLLPKYSEIEEISMQMSWFDKKKITKFCKHCQEVKNLEITRENIDLFSQITGVSIGVAMHFLHASVPASYENSRSKDLRQKFKLKKAQVASVAEEFPDLSMQQANAIFGDAMDAYEQLLQKPQEAQQKLVEKLAENWNKVIGQRSPIAPELLQKAKKQIPCSNYLDFFLHLNGSVTYPNYLTDGKWKLDLKEVCNAFKVKPDKSFSYEDLLRFVELTLWLYDKTAVGDPVRSGLVALVEEVKKRLTNPEFILVCYSDCFQYHEKGIKELKPTLEYMEGLLGKCKKPKKHIYSWEKNGIIAVFMYEEDESFLHLGFVPSKLKEISYVEKIIKLINKEEYDYREEPVFELWQLYKTKGFEDILKRIAQTPLQAQQWEQNPLYSAPKVVAEVQKKYKISQEAATLYLQTLTLAEPGKDNIKTWNNWKNSAYKAATQELTKNKLLLEAKRKRAGRDHFLPGGWLDLKSPDVPIELWKLPFYGLALDKKNKLIKPLSKIIPLKPLHQLFEEAWNRIKSGDIPKLEKVK